MAAPKKERTAEDELRIAAKFVVKSASGLSSSTNEFVGDGATLKDLQDGLRYWTGRLNKGLQELEKKLAEASAPASK